MWKCDEDDNDDDDDDNDDDDDDEDLLVCATGDHPPAKVAHSLVGVVHKHLEYNQYQNINIKI